MDFYRHSNNEKVAINLESGDKAAINAENGDKLKGRATAKATTKLSKNQMGILIRIGGKKTSYWEVMNNLDEKWRNVFAPKGQPMLALFDKREKGNLWLLNLGNCKNSNPWLLNLHQLIFRFFLQLSWSHKVKSSRKKR